MTLFQEGLLVAVAAYGLSLAGMAGYHGLVERSWPRMRAVGVGLQGVGFMVWAIAGLGAIRTDPVGWQTAGVLAAVVGTLAIALSLRDQTA